MPVDLFAASAHLLASSGAYQYVVAPFTSMRATFSYSPPTITPTLTDIQDMMRIGREWAHGFNVAQREVKPVWTRLLAHVGEPLVCRPPAPGLPPPAWWAIAHKLMVIADEASVDIGYLHMEDCFATDIWANSYAAKRLHNKTDDLTIAGPSGDDLHKRRHVALDSLAVGRARHIVRVLPKGRTTEIGCNMRTLSHNLALLPPRGQANVYWHQTQFHNPASSSDSLNLLLVPFPYVIGDGCFRGEEANTSHGDPKWGRFGINQLWLTPSGGGGVSNDRSRASFVAFADALLAEADAKGKPVQGVILPEYALDWDTYDALVRHLRDARPEIEFVIAGTSKDCSGRKGNFVISSIFGGDPRVAKTHSRQKHHRWLVEDTQIAGYDIKELASGVQWWEYLAVEERVLHVDVFRSRSTFTAVICEDLARVEPILTVLRALGPSLVFALLMDGAQVKSRWPGTYATSLADDPGSSVLTMTSLGLVARSMVVRSEPTDKPIIGLWKNRPVSGQTPEDAYAEINLENGHAVVLELASVRANETTLDGRRNDDANAWYRVAHQAIGLDDATVDANDWRWIVG